jgi:hypothetical protein
MCFWRKANIKDVPDGKETNMDSSTHRDYVAPKFTSYDELLLEEFKKENKIVIDTWSFRPGSSVTTYFGIEDGWGPNMSPGYVRIHQGIDRAGAITRSGIEDVVVCPFNFDNSSFLDYGNKSYGSLVILSSNKYAFDLRIGHMNPRKDIIPWALEQFKKKNPYQQGWLIGSAGTYGYSTGEHTHTELVSHDDSCEVLEQLLIEQVGELRASKSITDEEVIAKYKSQAAKYPDTSPYVGWSDAQILKDWTNMLKERAVFFINKHKSCFYWYGKPYTRYATTSCFNGL